jgi:4-diphosphocytidyl-2-C-methyl-D-erythritol kinase
MRQPLLPEVRHQPPAKVNLGLFVKGRRADGYHTLETVFLPAPLTDDLVIRPAPELAAPQLQLAGMPIQGSLTDNLVCRAWHLLREGYPDLPAVAITLRKRIPAGAGLGGGSSDAAHTLLGLTALFGLPETPDSLGPLALRMGADVPFFLLGKPMFATGIGEVLSPWEPPIRLRVVLRLSPHIHCDTAAAYRGLDLAHCHSQTPLLTCLASDPATWHHCLANDFAPQAFARHPELAQHARDLYAQGALYADLSGSGSAVFGVFPD